MQEQLPEQLSGKQHPANHPLSANADAPHRALVSAFVKRDGIW